MAVIFLASIISATLLSNTFFWRSLKGKLSTKLHSSSSEPPAKENGSDFIIGAQLRSRDTLIDDRTNNKARVGLSIGLAMLVGVGILFTTLIVVAFGIHVGKNQAQHDYDNAAKIHLTFKKDESQLFDEELVKANDTKRLMLLVQTKDLIITYVKDDKPRNGVFIIPRANLLSVHNLLVDRKE